jgi:hypothetical protein
MGSTDLILKGSIIVFIEHNVRELRGESNKKLVVEEKVG